MKIFVAGSNGLLGRELMDRLGARHTVEGADRPELDIADPGSTARALDAVRPAAVINAAAYTRVDQAETEREAAWRANVEGPRVLAEACARRGIRLVHLSTDYVFDGRRPPPQPYVETDPPHPLSWYGRTKLEGERAVLTSGVRAAILRTAWLYGAHGRHFLRALAGAAAARPGQALRVVQDQWGTPTWTARLAEQIERVLIEGLEGLFHATAEGACTWFDYACLAARAGGRAWTIIPCSSAEFPTPAHRPSNAILENAALKRGAWNVFRPWEEDVRAYLRETGEAGLLPWPDVR
jgi:dTDP-4-dehydrorhamnose reductase